MLEAGVCNVGKEGLQGITRPETEKLQALYLIYNPNYKRLIVYIKMIL